MEQKSADKRKVILIGVCCLLAVALIGFFLIPKSPFSSGETVKIRYVKDLNQGDPVEITDQIDLERLERLLPLMRFDRFPISQHYDINNQGNYEIETDIGGVFIGPERFSYMRAEHYGAYKLQNSDAWLALMELLVENGTE